MSWIWVVPIFVLAIGLVAVTAATRALARAADEVRREAERLSEAR
ncbi:MAG: hypothetical protein ACRD29_24840 [Acidimicrobiales bacterium]